MSIGSKGLGRGLNALFDNTIITGASDQPEDSPQQAIRTLPLTDIVANPNQPRHDFDRESLAELSQSIREQGVIQPIIVRPAPQGHAYQIVAGERRYRAAQEAGLLEIPVVVREYSDEDVMLAALIENLQREDLNPVEEALAIAALRDKLQMTQDEISCKLGKSRSAVSNALRLLQLSEPALEDLRYGRISAGHARALLGVDDGDAREALRARIAQARLSVREAEEAVTTWKQQGRFPWEEEGRPTSISPLPGRRKPETLKLLQQRLNTALPFRTSVSGTEDKGKITLSYASPEELKELLARLGMEG